MKLNYYPETDSLYTYLSSKKSAESIEISECIIIDYDENGQVTGIDIDNASRKIISNKIPVQLQETTA